MFNPSVISDRRKRAGLSQAALGSALGVHKNTVLAWEKGKQPINLEEFLKFCEVVGESPFSVISGGDLAAENATPYRASAIDVNVLAQAIALVLQELQNRKATLPAPKIAAAVVEIYELAVTKGTNEVTAENVTPFVRLLLA